MPLAFNAVDRLELVRDWSRGKDDEVGMSLSVSGRSCVEQIEKGIGSEARIEPAPPWLAGMHPTVRVQEGAFGLVDRSGGPIDQEQRWHARLVWGCHRAPRSLGLEYVGYDDVARVLALRYGWRYRAREPART